MTYLIKSTLEQELNYNENYIVCVLITFLIAIGSITYIVLYLEHLILYCEYYLKDYNFPRKKLKQKREKTWETFNLNTWIAVIVTEDDTIC